MSNKSEGLDEIREAVDLVSQKLGRRLGFLMGKPGLDGHSNGAEQIAARARDCGMEIAYDGIRLTPEQLIASVQEHQPHVIGLSILSGSHIPLVEDMMKRLQLAQLDNIPVVVGGIIPQEDMTRLTCDGRCKNIHPERFRTERHYDGYRQSCRSNRFSRRVTRPQAPKNHTLPKNKAGLVWPAWLDFRHEQIKEHAVITTRSLRPNEYHAWQALWRGYLAFYETELAEHVYRTTFERLCSSDITTQNAIMAELGGEDGGSWCIIFFTRIIGGSKMWYICKIYSPHRNNAAKGLPKL